MIRKAGGPVRAQDFEPLFREKRRRRLESVALRVEQDLAPMLGLYDKTTTAVEELRAKLRIRRQPERYRAGEREIGFWIIAVAVLAEFLFSSYAYGQHLPNMAMGMAPAILPAGITVVLGFLTVTAARYVAVPRWPHKLAGLAASTVFGSAACACLVAAAHFRDRFERGGSLQVEDVEPFVERMLSDPLGLSDASWWLLLFSLTAFALVCWHWWRTDDPIAGYGEKARAVDAAEEAAARMVSAIQNEIKVVFDGTSAEADEILHRQREALKDAIAEIDRRLSTLGIENAETLLIEEADGEIRALVSKRQEAAACLAGSEAHGEMALVLSRRAGEAPDAEREPEEVKELTLAVTPEEGWLWLDRVIERLGGFDKEGHNDGAA